MKLSTRTRIGIARTVYHALAAGRRLFGAGDSVAARRGGIEWRLDLREGIDLAIYLFGHFERTTVRAYRRLLRPGDTVFDVGANIGAHTLPFAQCVGPAGKVVAFEPTEYAFGKLRRNIAANPALAGRIVAEQILLAATPATALPGETYSSWPLADGGASLHQTHRGRPMQTAGARVSTLDAYVRETRVDFIKIDVDGHECAVLRGARATLARLRPALIVEIAPYALAEQGDSLEELLALLVPLGYRFYDLAGRALPADARLAASVPAGGGINVLCASADWHKSAFPR